MIVYAFLLSYHLKIALSEYHLYLHFLFMFLTEYIMAIALISKTALRFYSS